MKVKLKYETVCDKNFDNSINSTVLMTLIYGYILTRIYSTYSIQLYLKPINYKKTLN